MVYTLANRCSKICLGWAKLQTKLKLLTQILLINGFPVKISIHIVKESTITVEKENSSPRQLKTILIGIIASNI